MNGLTEGDLRFGVQSAAGHPVSSVLTFRVRRL